MFNRTAGLSHPVTDLYFDTWDKYDKVFCLPSEASHFASNKQFAAKFLTRAPSENILLCQQIMQHLPGNTFSPAPWSRSTNETDFLKNHQFPAYSEKKYNPSSVLYCLTPRCINPYAVIPLRSAELPWVLGGLGGEILFLEEQKRVKAGSGCCVELASLAGEPAPYSTGSAKRAAHHPQWTGASSSSRALPCDPKSPTCPHL